MSTIQKQVSFRFKKKLDEKTGMETTRQPETLTISYPLVASLITSASEKGLQLIQEAVEAVIDSRAKELLKDYTSANFPYSELDWEKIATMPPAQRRGTGISTEQWEAFLAEYSKVMPALTNKSQEQVDNAAAILGRRLATVKNSKEHLAFFEKQLGIFMESPNAADYSDVLEYLVSKIEEYKSLTAEDILAKL